MSIHLENVTIHNGGFRLSGVSLHVPRGQYGVLMGRTGSGKTTLLELIAGLKPLVSGRILLDDHDVTGWKAADRQIGYVPQDGALFPAMSVRGNVSFALRIRGQDRKTIEHRVQELARMLEIEGLLERRIEGLSGGERQRVALARALAFRPQTLCLDEPLSAIDEATRQPIIQLLRRIQRETGVTVLHVTHHQEEARQLADVRLELVNGEIQRR